MKSIMISIKPKWVAKILNGEKTIEVRKSYPKCDLPINVYIYCTKDTKNKLCYVNYEPCGNKGYLTTKLDCESEELNGKIVAKFTLNKVEEIRFDDKEAQRKTCLTEDELFDYLFVNEPYHEDMRKGYAWHIDNLVIFDKPKELQEFKIKGFERIKVMGNPYGDLLGSVAYHYEKKPILKSLTKAPQSWCYVEVKI